MITLDGTYSWVLSYTNKHNISGRIVESINTGDWTFCTSVKPEWNPDKLTLNIDDKGYRGGILVRNGMHSGIFNVLWPTETGDGWLKFIIKTSPMLNNKNFLIQEKHLQILFPFFYHALQKIYQNYIFEF